MLLIKAAGINDTNTEGRPASRNEKCPRAAKAVVTTEIVTLVSAPETRTPKLVVKQILPGFPVNALLRRPERDKFGPGIPYSDPNRITGHVEKRIRRNK